MKLIGIIGMILSVFIAGVSIGMLGKKTVYVDCGISKDMEFVCEFVSSDTTIQKYMLDPSYRIQVKHAIKDIK
tara:strand:- start:3501 stop:3719 length:219 start_codon:yes stop_codon:yes gene_type:complete